MYIREKLTAFTPRYLTTTHRKAHLTAVTFIAAAMAQTQATLENLAATVVELSKSISSSLKSQGLEAPSFAADSPNYPPNLEVQGPRMMLIETLSNMLYLAMGPTDVALMRPAFECISGFPPVRVNG